MNECEEMRKRRYFQKLARNLQYEGFAVKPETEDGLLPVELDDRRLCLVLDTGALRYWAKDVDGDARGKALSRATDIAEAAAEYMGQVEAAPQLTAGSLTGGLQAAGRVQRLGPGGPPPRSRRSYPATPAGAASQTGSSTSPSAASPSSPRRKYGKKASEGAPVPTRH